MNEEKNHNTTNEPVIDNTPPPPPPPPPVSEGTPPPLPPPAGTPPFDPQKKILVGILGIILGAFGVHKFMLGYQKEGFIMLGVSIAGLVLSCVGIGLFITMGMSVVGLVEGIIYLTKPDEEFYETYIKNQKPWF
jgi:TM2 domain-containing membrane protein YozV